MISVSIDVIGLAEALGAINKLEAVVSDFSSETQKIGAYLMNFYTNEVYVSQGNAFGEGWRDLSMPYAYYKFKRWGPQLLLVASGRMMRGYHLYTATDMLTIKNEATNKNGDFYAAYHQDGTEKMPRRTLIKMDDDRLEKIIEIVIRSLAERLLGI